MNQEQIEKRYIAKDPGRYVQLTGAFIAVPGQDRLVPTRPPDLYEMEAWEDGDYIVYDSWVTIDGVRTSFSENRRTPRKVFDAEIANGWLIRVDD